MFDGGCRPPLPAPCILCARAVRRGCGAFRFAGSAGPIGLPDRIVRSAGATLTSLPWCVTTRFTAAGARFSAGRQPSSPAGRVTAKVDRLVRATLVRFPRVGVPSAFAGRAVPSGVAVSRTIPLRRFSRCRHPTGVRSRPCGFSTPRVFPSFRSYGKRRPAGHSPPDSFTAVYRARAGRSRDLGGPLRGARRRSWGSPVPFAAFLLACGRRRVSRVTGPTCRLRPFRHRECFRSRARDKPSRAVADRSCGSWAFVPRPSRSLRSTGPAIAFARRADAMHGPLLPWVSMSSLRVSESRAAGLRFRSLSAGACRRRTRSSLQRPGTSRRRRARWRCAGPRA
jgi:hypothetical protein